MVQYTIPWLPCYWIKFVCEVEDRNFTVKCKNIMYSLLCFISLSASLFLRRVVEMILRDKKRYLIEYLHEFSILTPIRCAQFWSILPASDVLFTKHDCLDSLFNKNNLFAYLQIPPMAWVHLVQAVTVKKEAIYTRKLLNWGKLRQVPGKMSFQSR